MGTFSFTKADLHHTTVANIMHDKPFKCLIPAAFGGKLIKDTYDGYGKLTDQVSHAEYDMFELLAFWNAEMPVPTPVLRHAIHSGYWKKSEPAPATIKELLRYDGEFTPMKTMDNHTTWNRLIGIMMGTFQDEVDKLRYPLKLVSASCRASYEDLQSRSYTDPNQGLSPLNWVAYDNYFINYRQTRLDI